MDASPPFALNSLAHRLRHVRWLGGGSGAGKSVIARRLAADHGLRLYSCDDAIADHARRLAPTDAPLLHAFLAMSMDERWAERSPEEMLRTFSWFQGEGFDLLVADLLTLPPEPPILIEGFRLLPRLVAPLLAERSAALWLIPTPTFRRVAFARRGTLWEIAGKTSHPERALANLLARDALFTDEVTREATELGFPILRVDGALGEDEMTRLAARSLQVHP